MADAKKERPRLGRGRGVGASQSGGSSGFLQAECCHSHFSVKLTECSTVPARRLRVLAGLLAFRPARRRRRLRQVGYIHYEGRTGCFAL